MKINYSSFILCLFFFISICPAEKPSQDDNNTNKRADYREKLNRRNYTRGGKVNIKYLAQKLREASLTTKKPNQRDQLQIVKENPQIAAHVFITKEPSQGLKRRRHSK
jgi:hypothetical protein